jgi:hypothetical protein
MQVLILPVIDGILISAWGSRTKRKWKKVLIKFKMGSSNYEQVFIIAGQLMSDVILGANVLNELEVVMDFKSKCLVTNVNGGASSHDFFYLGKQGLEPASSPINEVYCTQATAAMETCGTDPMTRVKFAGSHKPEFSDSRVGHQDNIKVNEGKFDSGKRIPACVEIVFEEESYGINEGAVIPETFY